MSIADAATQVSASGMPVLFLDTCSILDVIRAPARGLVRCVESATELLELATASRCNFVVGSFVPGEWNDHQQEVLDLVTTHLDKMQAQAAHFHDLCSHLNLPITFAHPEYPSSGLAAQLHALSANLLAASLVLDRANDTMARAYERVAVTRRRPCRKGGELKDCTIFEECLEVCRQARGNGFTRKLVFCTSNTDDYCAPGVTPHLDVATDCAAVGLIFTTNLPWALSEIKT